jgi:hypothetical protein
MTFANESACLTADNIWNEVVTDSILNEVLTIHRSQEVLQMLSFYM